MTALAHESRNVLQRSVACLKLLSKRVKNMPEALELIADAQAAQDNVVRLFEQVRRYAAPVLINSTSCPLGQLLEEAWQHLETMREGRNVRLQHDYCPLDLECEVDPPVIREVFRNIFENALSACEDSVEVSVQYDEVEIGGDPAVRVRIHNNGPALTVEQLKGIFEAFYTTKTHGTGLGMSLGKRFVEAHHGDIAVDNVHGSGVEVRVTLPRKTRRT